MNDQYFGNLIHYIHHNPVKDGLVTYPAEWPHSSFLSLLSEKPTLLSRTETITFFGSRDAFLKAHKLDPEDQFLKMVLEF